MAGGAAVVRDVLEHGRVAGVPARPMTEDPWRRSQNDANPDRAGGEPAGPAEHSDRERGLVAEVLGGDVLAMGPYTERFEAEIAALASRRHAVACSSGTAGLHLPSPRSASARATRSSRRHSASWHPRTRSSTSARLRFSSTSSTRRSGSIPTGSRPRSPRSRAILPVDVFGHPCRIEVIEHMAATRGSP